MVHTKGNYGPNRGISSQPPAALEGMNLTEQRGRGGNALLRMARDGWDIDMIAEAMRMSATGVRAALHRAGFDRADQQKRWSVDLRIASLVGRDATDAAHAYSAFWGS